MGKIMGRPLLSARPPSGGGGWGLRPEKRLCTQTQPQISSPFHGFHFPLRKMFLMWVMGGCLPV